ncbi:MAG: imidazole glycerol phosphate synthase subunit HisH [Armatimonadetes bacterium]|nr:imidazole glycerol phosphate synthase subunit HisH [Armatimonadota bacterium]
MIAIIDYKAGNLTSVKLALEYIGASCEITSEPSRVLTAERVIFPGVGAAAQAMKNLAELGLINAIRQVIKSGTPFLGICLGTQVIFEFSEEDGGTPCLGILPGSVKLFNPSDPTYKIPQIGWNTVRFRRNLGNGKEHDFHPLFYGIEDESEFYFVHSYYPAPSEASLTVGETEYAGVWFASVVARDNLFATQFHPERSGRIGLRLLANFVRWNGKC